MWHNKSSSREHAFTKPWQKSQIDISGGDMVEFRSPSPGRDRRFPRGLCIVLHNVRWEPGKRQVGGRGSEMRTTPGMLTEETILSVLCRASIYCTGAPHTPPLFSLALSPGEQRAGYIMPAISHGIKLQEHDIV